MLERFEPLIGEWDVEVPQFPDGRGRATFAWIEDGRLLRYHAAAPDPAPDSTWIIGADDASATCTALYTDSRDVWRVYLMTFDGTEWTVWREAPGFWQRFRGRLDEGGATLRGAWEMSADGSRWEHDFDMVFTRVR